MKEPHYIPGGKEGIRPRKLVLVADDEPMVAATLVELLQTEGFDSLAVSNGESALFWARMARPIT